MEWKHLPATVPHEFDVSVGVFIADREGCCGLFTHAACKHAHVMHNVIADRQMRL
ncbi:MAG TPA: hypothetical protein VGM03_03445 [Phycisphaerae bacterium]|jgi:hypothetical protein